ncbi:hypothetical protein F4813DRAFT_234488 [Daldinia decipiens]|uniref:uncharacterized protein n=1 Tax=Daldinia decipiens TaxID=326647 RepID=UPI0020C2564B|nr:uncharacterized protein F4813DRAFT_234488 [Daldinia decipiens]KAI1654080.1 hypothetical protein F4813DRAFT_234488 [Daldinia decipiens]
MPLYILMDIRSRVEIRWVAAFTCILARVFLLWRRRRKCHEEDIKTAENTLPPDGNLQPTDTMSGHTCSDRSASARLAQWPYYNTECSEMPGQSSPVELGPGQREYMA